MSDAELWAALVGFALPLLVAIVNRPSWSSEARGAVAIASSLAAAVGTAWFTGQVDPMDVARTFLIVFTLAVGTYNLYWRPSGIAPAIERATSPAPR